MKGGQIADIYLGEIYIRSFQIRATMGRDNRFTYHHQETKQSKKEINAKYHAKTKNARNQRRNLNYDSLLIHY